MSIALERRLRLLESRVAELERRLAQCPVAGAANTPEGPTSPVPPLIPLKPRPRPTKNRTSR